MIRLTLVLDDPTADLLLERATNLKMEESQVATALLRTALKNLPADGRVVVLSGPNLERLEAKLGGLPILHSHDLLQKISHLAGISFEHMQLPFSPQQLQSLQDKAERQGKSVEELIELAAPRMYEMFFDLVPR